MYACMHVPACLPACLPAWYAHVYVYSMPACFVCLRACLDGPSTAQQLPNRFHAPGEVHAIDNAFRGQLDGLRDAVLQDMDVFGVGMRAACDSIVSPLPCRGCRA